MDQAVATPAQASAVVELRQYTLHPGRRDTLIELFESRFAKEHEASGMRLHGEFRDADDPDRFVWIRGFPDMASRARSLDSFYGGAVWKREREAANATMVDSDNVLLLKPAGGEGFTLAKRMTSLMVATIYLLHAPVDDAFARFFGERIAPAMTASGAAPVAQLRTEYAANDFPRLPVREGEHAFVWFAAFDGDDEYRRHRAALAASPQWKAAQSELLSRLKSPEIRLRLVPTAASLQRNAQPFHYSLDRTGDIHDFDFIAGSWTISNRRLKARGVGSTEWDEFPAQSRGEVLMGGVVNVDEISFPTKGWAGVTFRTFDVAKRQWSIYWVNSRDGRMTPPQLGGFDGDVGLFYGEDDDGGRPVKVVYKWTKRGPDAASWEQAFSYDGGATWETNWTNELTRMK
ncbi:MAG: NIPSNAP family protein [Usitatibacter sp.]